MSLTQNQPQQEQDIYLYDVINTLRRRWKAFMTGFLVVFVPALLYTFLIKPVYEATSTLYVKEETAKFDINEVLMPGSTSPVEAEMEILKSRTIAEQVVRELHLDLQIEPSSSDASCRVMTFLSNDTSSYYLLTLTGSDTYVIENDNGRKLGIGKSNLPFWSSELTLQAKIKGKKGDSFKLTHLNFNKVVEDLREATTVNEAAKLTNVISVSCQNTDPELSGKIVNTMVQIYLNKSLIFKTQEASRSVNFIEEQLQGIKDDLNKAELALQQYKSSSGVVLLDSEAQELIKSFSELEKDRTGINLQKKQIEFALASQQESLSQGKSYSPAVMKDDPLVADMAKQLSELEVQKRSLLVEYTMNHPAVQTIQAQIDELQRKIRGTYETALHNMSKQESDILIRLAKYEQKMREIPVEERDLARYTRVAKVSADIYTFLLQKHEEARISKASTISNINIIDTAITPDVPIKPEILKYLAIGLLFGLMTGCGLALYAEYIDDSVKNEAEAKKLLGFTHLATIPHIGSNDDNPQNSANFAIIAHTDPRSAATEAFRAVRTGIHFSTINQNKQVIMLTSAFPGEGKSTISSNIAVIMAQTGVRTLLIDCDMHKSVLHKWMEINKAPGLSDVLVNDVNLIDVLHQTSIPNLSFLPSGTTPPNPSILLGSSAMRELIERVRGMYDQIIIDAPPILPVADTVVLTSLANIVLLVMESARVPSKAALRIRELLSSAHAPVAGFVFNNKTMNGMNYGYNYGYDYGYGREKDLLNKKRKQ